MKKLFLMAIFALSAMLAGCGGGSSPASIPAVTPTKPVPPIAVFVHGGGWVEGDITQFKPVLAWIDAEKAAYHK